MTEREKQLREEWFDLTDPELKAIRVKCNQAMCRYNQLDNYQTEERTAILKEIFGHVGEDSRVKSNFQCDYGINIFLGDRVFVNCNCVFTDVGLIEIGDDTLIGPQVGIYAVNHPLDPVMRKSGIERAGHVKIGKNCWIGGHATINPGVTLGDNVVVASGAVVTKSFGDNVLIGGVPAKILKEL